MKDWAIGAAGQVLNTEIHFLGERMDAIEVDDELGPAAPDDEHGMGFYHVVLALGYLAKMLYNLGDDPSAFALRREIAVRGEEIDDPSGAIPSEGWFRSLLVEPDEGASQREPTVTWVATLTRHDTGLLGLTTSITTIGDPRVMAPSSTLALFDFTAEVVNPGWLTGFLAALGGMLSFYDNRQHTSLQFVDAAPQRGLDVMGAWFENLGST